MIPTRLRPFVFALSPGLLSCVGSERTVQWAMLGLFRPAVCARAAGKLGTHRPEAVHAPSPRLPARQALTLFLSCAPCSPRGARILMLRRRL